MQSYHVKPLDLGDSDSEDEYLERGEIPEITKEEYASIDKIKEGLLKFKTNLYHTRVGNSTGNPEDLGALTSFDALFLDCISYLIRLLNGEKDTLPELPEEQKNEFNTIIENMREILRNSNTSILVYNILTQIKTMPISMLASER